MQQETPTLVFPEESQQTIWKTVKTFTLSGDGIGFLPSMICSEEARQGKIVRVLPQWHGASASLFFIYPAHRFVSPKVRTFIDLAGEVLKNRT